MARTSTYLNFPGTTEAAFAFYKSVFGTEYSAPIQRMGDVPASPDAKIEMPLQLMFWGAYWASLQDRFGIHWTINVKG